MQNLKKFIQKQADLDRLLNEFEFSDEAERVAKNVCQAALAYQKSSSYKRLSKREKVTFSFHIISLTRHLKHIQRLQEGRIR